MRCPKCGYTSFDDLERCKKCKKPLPAPSATLTGTVLEAIAPAYLNWAAPVVSDQLDMGGNKPVFAATEELPRAANVESGADLRLSESDAEAAPAAQEQGPTEELNLDLGKVDISDLTPPEPTPSAAPVEDDDFSLENLQVDELGLGSSSPDATPTSGQYQPAAKTGTALDNFDVELDELLDVEESEKA